MENPTPPGERQPMNKYVAIVIAIIILAALYILLRAIQPKNKPAVQNVSTNTAQSATTSAPDANQPVAITSWKNYTGTTYGISFDIGSDWEQSAAKAPVTPYPTTLSFDSQKTRDFKASKQYYEGAIDDLQFTYDFDINAYKKDFIGEWVGQASSYTDLADFAAKNKNDANSPVRNITQVADIDGQPAYLISDNFGGEPIYLVERGGSTSLSANIFGFEFAGNPAPETIKHILDSIKISN